MIIIELRPNGGGGGQERIRGGEFGDDRQATWGLELELKLAEELDIDIEARSRI